MSPIIELSEPTFRRLQELAIPFVDTPETVIVRALDQLKSRPITPQSSLGSQITMPPTFGGTTLPSGTRMLDPDHPDELSHTRVLSGRFAQRNGNKWNKLLAAAHAETFARLGSFAAVRSVSQSSLFDGKKEDLGFHFQPDGNFSIQYVDANKAWQHTLSLAKLLGTTVEVQFRWHEKDEAKYPGEFGVLRWAPKTN